MKPSRSEPLTLMTKVPHGNAPSVRSCTNPSSRYRAGAPTEPAINSPTKIVSVMFPLPWLAGRRT
jgi:hypothetical protein